MHKICCEIYEFFFRIFLEIRIFQKYRILLIIITQGAHKIRCDLQVLSASNPIVCERGSKLRNVAIFRPIKYRNGAEKENGSLPPNDGPRKNMAEEVRFNGGRVRSFVRLFFSPTFISRLLSRGRWMDGCSSRDALKTRGKDASLVKHNLFVFIREKHVLYACETGVFQTCSQESSLFARTLTSSINNRHTSFTHLVPTSLTKPRNCSSTVSQTFFPFYLTV